VNIKKLRDIIKRDREISLSHLSRESGETAEDIEYILKEWLTRGKIEPVYELTSCASGGCSGCLSATLCNTSTEKKYRWV